MKPRRAVIYCRISQDREGAGLGIERQREDCEALAERLGWQIVAVRMDNDVSAYSGKRRPGYQALLADLDTGSADAVLAWHTDRLHRSPRELEDYIDLCERRKVVTQTVKAGALDLATSSGRMVARMLGAAARQEVEHKSDRTKRAQLQAAQAGKWLGGAPPLGWHLREGGGAVLDRNAAREIRNAATSVLAGASVGSIVRRWNAKGFTTSTGGPWNYTSARQVLTRARNAGLVELNGEIVGRSPWPAILTEEQHHALVALFADPSRRKSQSNRARWLLAGIARCGGDGCGHRLKSATVASNRAKGTTRVVYKCRVGGVGHVGRAAEPLDALVRAVIEARLARPDVADLVVTDTGPDIEVLRADAIALRLRLGEAADQFADGAITAAQLAKITIRVQDRLTEVEAAMSRAARDTAMSGIVASVAPVNAWRRATIDAQRAVVRELLTVTVLPSGKRGNVFDPELVRIEWRT